METDEAWRRFGEIARQGTERECQPVAEAAPGGRDRAPVSDKATVVDTVGSGPGGGRHTPEESGACPERSARHGCTQIL